MCEIQQKEINRLRQIVRERDRVRGYLNEEVYKTLMFFIKTDIETHGCITSETLEAINTQSYQLAIAPKN
jgi:hypothetical protein